ncbi:MAG: hypothetical protein PHY59_07660, partial [Methanobacterium sp.]|nr:hypothetical protein [Methanobacterium sp.]
MKIKTSYKSVLLSVFLISILLLGSNSAFAVSLYISDVVTDGNEAGFIVDLDLDDNERVPLENFTVEVKYANGSII